MSCDHHRLPTAPGIWRSAQRPTSPCHLAGKAPETVLRNLPWKSSFCHSFSSLHRELLHGEGCAPRWYRGAGSRELARLCRSAAAPPHIDLHIRRNWTHAQFTICETIDDARDITAINPDVAQQAIVHASKSFDHLPALPLEKCGSEPTSKRSGLAVALSDRSRGWEVRGIGFEDVGVHVMLHDEETEPCCTHNISRATRTGVIFRPNWCVCHFD